MPGRDTIFKTGYRYGFNGKEMDNETYGGQGNEYDYGFRIYNPRVGRFLSVDPLTNKYPELTPYQYASNRLIDGIDLDGLEHAPAGLFGPNGPRDNTAVQTMPLNAVSVQKVNIQSAARINYLNQWIIAPDIFGKGHIGPRYIVQANIASIGQNYYNAVGDNIANGPGGATGYLIAGDKGSFVGAAGDQIMYSFGGLDREGYLGKPRVTIASEPSDQTTSNTATKKANQLRINQANSDASEEMVYKRLQSVLGEDEAILLKPRIYIGDGSSGKYAVPDFAIYNTKTGQFSRIVDAKDGGGDLTPAQQQLNEQGGTFRGSSRAPNAKPQKVQPNSIQTEKTNVNSGN